MRLMSSSDWNSEQTTICRSRFGRRFYWHDYGCTLKKAPSGESARKITVGDLTIDSARRWTEIAGEEIDLTTAEFDLLWRLAENAGNVVSRESIYLDLVGVPYDGVDRSIDLRISRLRRKLKDNPSHPDRIKSIRGVGYMLVLDK